MNKNCCYKCLRPQVDVKERIKPSPVNGDPKGHILYFCQDCYDKLNAYGPVFLEEKERKQEKKEKEASQQ